ncbi:hypothetical protein F5144DRAFT_612594 [Chaetomium tenue]|uniref:Uncharacterized protein n=1 Tax=Chaetomium tenue TaxID=1854479 RepID=A0ACB7P7U5_9PEZI|nr:hypothetical protein F5144DRAFT_612594 [Chaetomium globosum]
MASQCAEPVNTIIVGIDFGTTYSGVAFTWSKKIERMEFRRGESPNRHSFGPKGKTSWGYNIPFDAEQGKWFKLLLIDDKDLPEDVRKSTKIKEARTYLKKHNKTPVAVIAGFLRLLWNHCNQRITETVSRSLVNYSKFHIVITLPAIWPDYARNRMREAAEQAGMLAARVAGETTLSFISEPEAAALATLSDMEGRCDIMAGDSFVVVDCGGGTVDLISYKVENTTPMVVKDFFKDWANLTKFGEAAWSKMEAQTRHRFMHDEWDHGIKPTFDDRERKWILNMPFECIDLNSMKGKGFSLPNSKRFRRSLMSKYAVKLKTEANPKHFGNRVEVLQSRGSGPAVIHAANIQRLPTFLVNVQARVARASYGVMLNKSWREEVHNPDDKYYSEDRQKWMAQKQMRWFLNIGDDMSASEPVKIPIRKLYNAEDAAAKRISSTIYLSKSNPSPGRWKDGGVEELCTIKWDAKLDISSLPTFTNPLGRVFYQLDYTIKMTSVGGSLDFAVYRDGKRQGSKNIVVEYDSRSSDIS